MFAILTLKSNAILSRREKAANLDPDSCIIGIRGAHAHEAQAAPIHHAEAEKVVLLLSLPLHDATLHTWG